MKKAFLTGVGFLLLSVVICLFILSDGALLLKVIGGAGLLSLVLAMLSSGALVSGDRMRANFHTETKESRTERIGMMSICLAFSIPNLIGAATCIAIVVWG